MPLPRTRPSDLASYPPAAAVQNPLILAPAFAPADDDPLAPLIMRSSFVNSYAEDAPLTPAQNAADALVNGRFKTTSLEAALARAVAKRAQQIGTGEAVVRLGTFGDPANAARVATDFGRFGKVSTTSQNALTVVSVAVPAGTAPSVISAATDAGLSGAFIAH
jgi:hypothetical protein